MLCILPFLHCPNTKEPLQFAPIADISKLGFGAGYPFGDDVTGVLFGANQKVAYPVRGQIIDLRPESVITVNAQLAEGEKAAEYAVARRNVQQWYESFGWRRNEEGVLNDSAYYSRRESTAYGLYEKMSHLAQAERFSGGKFLLDAASGAIAHPEYLAYSFHHKYRVCVDFSEVALEEASQKIGNHGIYVLADVCQLPFADDLFHGVISGYTVQHIHRDQQRAAIEELYRVLKPGYRLCLMASQETGFTHTVALRIGRIFNKLKRRRALDAKIASTLTDSHAVTPPYQLYGHCWDFRWWKDCASSLGSKSKVHCLRLFGKPEFDNVIRSRAGVRRLRGFEMLFSRALARASALIVVDIEKREGGQVGSKPPS